eukprot:3641570-Pleurochrysis_carterae.AAC.1
MYDEALSRLRTGEKETLELRGACEDFERLLKQAEAQRQEESERLCGELQSRDRELQGALVECRAKATLLTAVLGDKAAVEAQSEELQRRIAQAESDLAAAGAKLADNERDLQQTSAMRSQLEAECASLQRLAADELREAEAQRLREVTALLGQCEARAHELESQRAELSQLRERATSELSVAKEEAQRELVSRERKHGELWGRLHKQALFGAALSKRLAETAATARELRSEAQRVGEAVMHKEYEVESLRAHLREAKLAHLRHALVTGVWALKHGRKGKPHSRHVKCTANLLRLEWGRAAVGGSAAHADKGMGVDEIIAIEPGLTTDVAKRSGKGKASHFLSVISQARTLDLELSSEQQRDMWLETLRAWREATACDPELSEPPASMYNTRTAPAKPPASAGPPSSSSGRKPFSGWRQQTQPTVSHSSPLPQQQTTQQQQWQQAQLRSRQEPPVGHSRSYGSTGESESDYVMRT